LELAIRRLRISARPAPSRTRRVQRALVAAATLVASATLADLAAAATIKGTVALPAELRSARRHPGYVRLENGNVPIVPPPHKADTVVVVQGVRTAPPSAKTVTVDFTGLGANPSTIVVSEGSVVEFKNTDRVPHDLSTPEQFSLMPIERLSPGNVRRQKFNAAGGYVVRCSEYPDATVSVIVVNSPYHSTVDERGQFRIDGVPNGSATLKVWSHGRWVHEEHVVVNKDLDVNLRVQAGKDNDRGSE
jgi:plastocyanin